MNITSDVSDEFLDEAEKQIFEILLKQRLSYNERWSNNPILLKVKSISRMVGLAASIFGAVLCAPSILGWVRGRPSLMGLEIDFIIFVITGIFFYFLPRCQVRTKDWTRNRSIKSCQKIAKKCIANARKAAPFKAEYDIKGGTASYYREKEGELKHVWFRKLKGVAIQSDFVTICFKKWTSFLPIMVVLHKDFEIVGSALRDQKIDCRLISEC